MKKLIYTFLIWLMFIGVGFPATYYMRSDGTAANKEAATGCGAASTAMNITVHNAEDFAGGDIINLCDDGAENYGADGSILTPPDSGSSGSVITYQKATGDTPTFLNPYNNAIFVNGKSYLVFDGLTFSGSCTGCDEYPATYMSKHQIRLYGVTTPVSHIEIKNCTFGNGPQSAINLWRECDYNYIHDNTFNAHWPLDTYPGPWGNQDTIYMNDSDYNKIIDNLRTR